MTADEALVLALKLWAAADEIERLAPTPGRRPVARHWTVRLLGRLARALKA
jgi:hypothetical protein